MEREPVTLNVKTEKRGLKMRGRMIVFIIIFILINNAKDLICLLYEKTTQYLQAGWSGFGGTVMILAAVPAAFDLKYEEGGAWIVIILETIYITIYTLIYFRIRDREEEEEIKWIKDRMNRELELMKKTENSMVVKDEEVQNEKQNEEAKIDLL